MSFQFQKHYTREEANALLPQIRTWLERLGQLRADLERAEKRLGALRGEGGDLGGDTVNQWIKTIASLKDVIDEFQRREIQLKDVERGLLDFPSLVGGREVFLCWEKDEESVEHWHELDSGFAGREPI